MFLDHVRKLGFFSCFHPNSSFNVIPSSDGKDEWIVCVQCNKVVLAIREFLCTQVSAIDSPALAHEYADWTGHVNVPCQISLKTLQSRVLPHNISLKFSTLYRGYQLLRAIHSPFVRRLSEEGKDEGHPTKVDPKLFRNLMTEYLHLIDRVSVMCEKDTAAGEVGGGETSQQPQQPLSDALTVKTILMNMKNAFADVDIYEQYFGVLAPYVQWAHYNVECQAAGNQESSMFQANIHGTVWMENSKEKSDDPIGLALERELQRSTWIHKHFSPYCIPFEVVHVMVLCYLVGEDTETTYNLVLDMAAKLCTGYFFFPVSRTFEVGHHIRQFLDHHITPTSNLKLYYFLKTISKGGDEIADCFDEKFLRKYGLLEADIRKCVPMAGEDRSKLERFVYQQTFPYLLFEKNNSEEDSSYYAFVMALAHYISKSHTIGSTSSGVPSIKKSKKHAGNDTVPKGVVAECKQIYRFVRECIKRVRNFQQGEEEAVSKIDSTSKEQVMYWTKDMFNLFLTSNADLGEELAKILVLMM